MIRTSQLARSIAANHSIPVDDALLRVLATAKELEIVERILTPKQADEITLIVERELDQPAPVRGTIGVGA